MNRGIPMGRSIQIIGGSFRCGLHSKMVTFSTSPCPLYIVTGKEQDGSILFCFLACDWLERFYFSIKVKLHVMSRDGNNLRTYLYKTKPLWQCKGIMDYELNLSTCSLAQQNSKTDVTSSENLFINPKLPTAVVHIYSCSWSVD